MPPKVNKIEQEIRKLSKLEGNKVCADCNEKVPGYVDLTHNVFICTKCSGIHREFQFKIKGVSMSIFTEEDVAGLVAMGNEKFNSLYLSRLPSKDLPVNSNDTNKLKEFIRQKYVDKKWHASFGTVGGGGINSSSSSAAVVTGTVVTSAESHNNSTDKIKINFNRQPSSSAAVSRRASTGSVAPAEANSLRKSSFNASSNGNSLAGDIDLLSLGSPSKPSSSSSSSSSAFDPFASSSNQQHDVFGSSSTTHDPFGPSAPADHGFDAFSSNTGGSNGFDAFGGSNSSASSNYQFPPYNNNPTSVGAPLGFIQTNAPKTPAAPTTTTPATTPAPAPVPAKNFSAFDDLMTLSANPVPSNTSNPFDSPPPAQPQHNHPGYGAPGPSPGYPVAYPPNPTPAPAGYPGYPAGPGPVQPGYPAGYGPGPVPGYGHPAGYGPPPPGYGPPHNPGYPGAPGPGYGYGAPNPYAQGYGNPPANAPRPTQPPQQQQQQQHQQPPPAAAPAPDPFATMTSVAWSAVGGSAPGSNNSNPATANNSQHNNANPYSTAPQNTSYSNPNQNHSQNPYANNANPYSSPATNPYGQAPPPAPAPASSASVNPFDLF